MKLFDSSYNGKPFYIGKYLQEIDSTLVTITPPYMIHRLPRKLAKTMHHWKASELRSWLLYYGVPCLQTYLPEDYLVHFSLLVESTHLLLTEGISEQDLQRAEQLLGVFVKCAGKLYGNNFMGLNVHNLVHLVSIVRNWGPLWAWSCFSFESFNGDIKKSVHGKGNVCHQVFWSLQAQKQVEHSASADNGQESIRKFVACMAEGSSSHSNGTSAYQCSVYGMQALRIPLDNYLTKKLLGVSRSVSIKEFMQASKIFRNGQVFYSKRCTRVKKRNSFTAKTALGEIVETEFFLVHQETLKVFAVCRKLEVTTEVLQSRLPQIRVVSFARYRCIVHTVHPYQS